MNRWLLSILVCGLVGCGTDESGVPEVDAGVDVSEDVDASTDVYVDMPEEDVGNNTPGLEVIAANYCELTAEMFCGYYMRCGRMAVPDMATCLSVFDEQCNAVYEPHYRAFADAGMLELSASGIAQCASHLESVACEKQLQDLDGGCAQMWVGKVAVGGDCSPGIGSFVCGEESTCVLGLDFCGACEAAVGPGEVCGTNIARCDDGLSCVDNICVTRAGVGEFCSDAIPCRVGTGCVDGKCQGFTVVGLGDTCNASERCPYNSVCSGGVCVSSKAPGDSCAPQESCRSGYCDGVCKPLKAEGQTCTGGAQCISGICDQVCAPLVGACFE